MASDDRRKPDLDIFEGLGKKTPEKEPLPVSPFARNRSDMRRTMIGIPEPANLNRGPSSLPAAPTVPNPLPAPPGRGALPDLDATENTVAPQTEKEAAPMDVSDVLGAIEALGAPGGLNPQNRGEARADAVPESLSTQELHSIPDAPLTTPMLEIIDDKTANTVAIAAPSTTPSAVEQPPARNPKLDAVDWDHDDDATHVFEREAKKKALEEAAARAKDAEASSEVLSVPAQAVAEHASIDVIMVGPKLTGPPPPPLMLEDGKAVPEAPPPPEPPRRDSASLQAALGSLGQARSKLSSVPPPPTRGSEPPPPPAGRPLLGVPIVDDEVMAVPPPGGASAKKPSIPPPVPKKRRTESTQMVPRKQASNLPQMALFAGIVILLIGGALYFLVPRTSSLTVNVTDPQASTIRSCDVFVDGTKRCDSTPCTVHDLAPGNHELRVTAPGLESPTRTITFTRGHDVASDIQLAPVAPASKPVAPATSGTGFKVDAPSAGVKVNVDGKDIGVLPQEVHDLEAGDHHLRFSGDRYATLEKTISIAKDEIVDLGSVALKVTKGKATITLGTPGARVFLINGTNHKEVPQFPITLEFDTTEKWDLVATKENHDEYKERISFEDGQAEKTITVTLPTKSTTAKPVPTPRAPPKEPKEPKESAIPKTPEEAPAAGAETALKINSLPASSIVLDGKPIGVTPQPHVVVTPGPHTVMFVNAEQSLKKTITIEVKAGETKAAFARLRE